MDPFTLVMLAASLAFVLVVGAWLGAGSSNTFEGLFGVGPELDRPRGVQETDVPRFHIDPLIHPV